MNKVSTTKSFTLKEWEQVEINRSAVEANSVDISLVLAQGKNIDRYLHPNQDSTSPLEYMFYLGGNVQGKTVLEYGCGQGDNT